MSKKSKVFSIPTFILIVALLASPLFATIIRVPQDQPTIQAAIDVAENEDTILVAPGTYIENLNIAWKSITLKSVAGPDSTTLNPASLDTTIIMIMAGEENTTTIEGFRITGGPDHGFGAIHFYGSGGNVINNVFDDNHDYPYGGSIACRGGAKVFISENVFKNSTGAIYCDSSFVDIRRNLIIDHSSAAVVFIYELSKAKVINNTFVGNVGGALSIQGYSVAEVRNNIFSNNKNYGVHSGGGPTIDTVTLEYNDFIDSPLLNTSLGIGNIAVDPSFAAGVPFDYHLLGGSPCIDAGDPASPVPYGGGSRVDMGAFEFIYGPRFSLLFPDNNTNYFGGRPEFIWETLNDTSGTLTATYRLLLSTNIAFLPADSSPILTDTTWRVPYYLDFRQTYFWKVMAINDSGDTIFSQEVRFFQIIDSPPGSFSLVSPANTINIVTKTPLFDWGNAIDPDPVDTVKYTLIISSDSGFQFAYSQPNLSGSSFVVPPGVLNRGLRYFWRVKASDTQDSSKFSNEIFRFRLLYLGDVNRDGILSPADIVLLLNSVFLGASVDPPEVADMNCDGNPTPADVVLGLNAVFLGQPPPCDP